MILLQQESHVNQVIPDKGSLNNAIHIHHGVAIQSLKVGVDITHPFIGDLKVELTSPAGTTVVLHNRAGGSQDNIQKSMKATSLRLSMAKPLLVTGY